MELYECFPRILQHPIFSKSNPEHICRYFPDHSFSLGRFEEHAIAYSSATDEKKVGIMIEGHALVQTGPLSDSTLLNTIGPGALFGIANLYAEDEPFPTVIRAAEASVILFLDGSAFCDFLEHEPEAMKNFLRLQSQKIIYLNHKIATFTAGSAEKKLALFLLDHSVDRKVTLSCSMSALSNMLGLGRASLYRALDLLSEQGLIEKQGKGFYLIDPKGLAKLLS